MFIWLAQQGESWIWFFLIGEVKRGWFWFAWIYRAYMRGEGGVGGFCEMREGMVVFFYRTRSELIKIGKLIFFIFYHGSHEKR